MRRGVAVATVLVLRRHLLLHAHLDDRHAHQPKSSAQFRYRTDIMISWCGHIMINLSRPQIVAKSMLVSMHSPYLRPASGKKARKAVRKARASMQHCE